MHHGAAGERPGADSPRSGDRASQDGEQDGQEAGRRDGTCCDPALDRLAEAWITLWQGELAALAADPEVVTAWRQAFGLAATWLGTASRGQAGHEQPGHGREAGRRDGDGAAARAAGAARPAAAGAVPGDGPGDALDGADAAVLHGRIAELERRLAALEAGPAGGEADRRRPRRKRPSA